MNILRVFTLKTLKENKRRTIVTVIGIMLSTSLIMAVTTFAACFMQFMQDNSIYENGDWYVSVQNTDTKTAESVLKNKDCSDFSVAENIGYLTADGCLNPDKPYIYIIGVNDTFTENMPVHITKGRLPKNDGEIILPNHLSENGGVNYNLEDVVTWSVGSRIYQNDTVWQNVPYDLEETGEKIENAKEKTYRVVGFYERPDFEPYDAPGYTAITKADLNALNDTDEGRYSVWFKTDEKKAYEEYERLNKVLRESTTGVKLETNDNLLNAHMQSRYGRVSKALMSIVTVLIIVIMTGSVMLIYNSFAISVSERTKQFGLLSSVGATKRQIRKTVLFEAASLSIVGIFLGIFLGIGGVTVTLAIINPVIKSVTESPLEIHFTLSWTALLSAVGVSAATVLISAWLPSVRAMRITAIEAIRQNSDFKLGRRDMKTSKLTGKIFGFEGTLASKYFKRNRKKYKITIISLFVSIVLFITVSSFTSYLVKNAESQYGGSDYDIQIDFEMDDYNDRAEMLQKLKGVNGIDEIVWREIINLDIPIEQNKGIINKEYTDWTAKEYGQYQDIEMITVSIVDDESFRSYLDDMGLDEKKYMNPDKPLFIGSDTVKVWESDTEKYKMFHVFDETTGEIYLGNTIMEKMNIGYFTDNLIMGCNFEGSVSVIMPMCIARSMDIEVYGASDYIIKTDKHSQVAEDVEEILKADINIGWSITDRAEWEEQDRNIVFLLRVFAYGFIAIISLIAITNVFNTISTNVMLRRKEFAMLKTVGMTRKGFNKMMNFECIIYGSKAVLYGLPASVGISYLIYRMINNVYEFPFYIPASSVAISVGAVFGVVFVTMLYSMHKVKRENVIDVLKSENF